MCKDYKIKYKSIKNSCFSSRIILQCILSFRFIYVVQSRNKVFFPRHICSCILHIYIKTNNLQRTNSLIKHVGMLSFMSRQSNKKISVIEVFPVRGKQKNASSNNFTTQTRVQKIFGHVCNAKGC